MIPRSGLRARLVLAATACLAAAVTAGAADRRVVALSPVGVPRDLGLPRASAAAFDSLAEAALRDRGYQVVAPAEVAALRRELSDALGGAYDPRTGRPVGDRPDSLRARMRRELAARHGAVAWARPFLREFMVRFSGGRLRWEGLEEETGGLGGAAGFLLGRTEGRLPVLTYVLALDELGADTTHLGGGGIRLSRHVVRNKPVRVPPESLVADPGRLRRAVSRAADSTTVKLRDRAGP